MEAREGTEKEKPLPERMECASESATDSMVDWTEESGRSATSRQAVERLRSERTTGFAGAELAADDFRALSVWRIDLSALSLDLNRSGSDSESELSSARRRFFLSAIRIVGEAGN